MPREFKRTDRVAQAIQKEVAKIIQEELKDPRVGLVTIASVKVSKDFAHARVFVNVLFEDKAPDVIKTLNKASGFFRGVLSKRLQLRGTPMLTFVHDEATLKALRLSKLIDHACETHH